VLMHLRAFTIERCRVSKFNCILSIFKADMDVCDTFGLAVEALFLRNTCSNGEWAGLIEESLI